MLKPEQAKSRLDEWCLPESEDRIAAGVNSLPARIRDVGKIFCKCDGEAAKELDPRSAALRRRQAVIDFDRLSPNDRAALFGVVSPRLADAMEGAWQLLKTIPYQRGYASKAFRAPAHPQVTAECRFDWLETMASFAKSYSPELLTLPWLAAWAPHLGRRDIIYYHPGALTHEIGILLAAALARPGNDADEVFEILRQSLTNQHEIGAMGRHITEAFLLADRTEGWELIEKTLLAAQRQEGLRQAILESIDIAHPQAFRRMLLLILDHDLLRFSATVRAIDVWFGQLWAAASAGIVKKMLAQIVDFLDSHEACTAALRGKDPQAAFLALWCLAADNAVASIEPAQKLLRAKSVEMRYIAARHLANLDLDVASTALSDALDDEDLRVALVGLRLGQYETEPDELLDAPVNGHFEKIERLLERVPAKPQKLKPLVWPWTEIEVKQSQVAGALLGARGNRPVTCLIPHLNKMDTYARSAAAATILGEKPWGVAIRRAAFDLVGSASTSVREQALNALLEQTLECGEFERLESYLSRTSGDLRRGVLKVLLKQSDGEALASATRLVAAKHAAQRLAGLELLHLMADAQRSVPDCRRQAAAYRATRGKMSKDELAHLDEIAKDKASIAALDDALGLMNPADRTPVVPPRNLKTTFITAASIECLKSLDDLIHEHRELSIRYRSYSGMQEELLGNVHWGFPNPDLDKPRDAQVAHLPLADVWVKWLHDRPKRLRDDDGYEIVRALAWREVHSGYRSDRWKKWSQANSARKEAAKSLSGGHSRVECRYGGLVESILNWLLYLHPIDACDFLLDASESAYSLVPAADMESLASPDAHQFRHFARLIDNDDDDNGDWREENAFTLWPEQLSAAARLTGRKLTTDQRVRQWRLFHWRDEPFAGAPRKRPESDLLLDAFEAGAAALADIADALLGPRGAGAYSAEGFDLLAAWTQRTLSKEQDAFLSRNPAVRNLRDRAVARILEIELPRGDAPTAATAPAWFLGSLFGAATLHRILRALGKADFKRGYRWARDGNVGRRETLSELTSVTYPAADDTPAGFVRRMREAVSVGDFPEDRLLQLAFLAPQWTKFIQAYFGWDDFDEGVYWFLAHMSFVFDATQNAALAAGQPAEADADLAVEANIADEDEGDGDTGSPQPTKPRKLSPWERLIAERTPLGNEEREAGAIDVAWFRRTYESFGPKRWQAMAQAARFAANAHQAKRAQFIGEVLLNKVKRKDLIAGIKKKQLKEYVRLLGLLPLAAGKQREADLRERCQVLRDYRRYANTLSGLTKPDALRAWEIGLKNLAQTAGFADPLRLEWAVGAEAVKDLAKGPVTVVKDGVTVSLALDDDAQPVVTTRKGPKELKAIPPAIKKDKKIAELVARAADLRRQASSIRRSLETAMCRGDVFSGDELQAWCGHALLRPYLSRLVVVGEGILGYPEKGGKALRDFRGKLEPVKAKETLRLAHPHDLLASDDWHAWQHECFQAERMQPFKQVFRELYVVTKQEKKDGVVSHRYDGQQVQPKQAMALFGNRGWNTGDGVFKVFHDERLIVEIGFDLGITTPAEVEGWTMSGVSFRRSDEWTPLKLSAVPPRLFSEVMRDLDLVVSVAHAGGVDPEASASTVEMRSGLVRETCDLLRLKNVRLKSSHALIHGELADYNVHLGSGVVHRMPGGAVCIVPVHAQHRGRLFLPFADDDPRTAEVISKILLLARDREIQDPVILEQLRR